jgi:hypothetical protein
VAHHSGNWGGLISNPGVLLAHAIASLVDRDGHVLARGILPQAIPNSVRHALADLVVDPGPDGPTIDEWWGERGFTQAEKVFGWNTFEVLAMVTGNPDRPVNAVPPRAKAHCQIRFTIDKDPNTFLPALRKHLEDKGFGMVKVSEPSPRSGSLGGAVGGGVGAERSMGAKQPALRAQPRRRAAERRLLRSSSACQTLWVPHSYRRLLAARARRARARAHHARRPADDDRRLLGHGRGAADARMTPLP